MVAADTAVLSLTVPLLCTHTLHLAVTVIATQRNFHYTLKRLHSTVSTIPNCKLQSLSLCFSATAGDAFCSFYILLLIFSRRTDILHDIAVSRALLQHKQPSYRIKVVCNIILNEKNT